NAVTLAQLAQAASPGGNRPQGMEPSLEARRYFETHASPYSYGVHAVVAEVDADTGEVKVVRYAVANDAGVLINPTIVEGQIQGGVAQGIGGAFYERLHFDDSGQLLNASFMDFLMPTAAEVPEIEIAHIETPSPLNPLGVKGVGEAGTIPVAPLLAEAIEDALAPFGVRIREMPLSPVRIRELIDEAARTQAVAPA
ncbi:MAG: xanthine dehydrogenase family protein molybdopterin-binding subunit, partial [Chloroflexi bacterium]|nr:xanthine dehydrogenase family protein molybdopterin-binding subunit [Chloroflexota bacterium]